MPQINYNVAVTDCHTLFVAQGAQYVWAASYEDDLGMALGDGNGTGFYCYL